MSDPSEMIPTELIDDDGALRLMTTRYGGGQALIRVDDEPDRLKFRWVGQRAGEGASVAGRLVDLVGAILTGIALFGIGWVAFLLIVAGWLGTRFVLGVVEGWSKGLQRLAFEVDESEFVLTHAGRKIVGDTSDLTEVTIEDDELLVYRQNGPPLELMHLATGNPETLAELVKFLDARVRDLSGPEQW